MGSTFTYLLFLLLPFTTFGAEITPILALAHLVSLFLLLWWSPILGPFLVSEISCRCFEIIAALIRVAVWNLHARPSRLAPAADFAPPTCRCIQKGARPVRMKPLLRRAPVLVWLANTTSVAVAPKERIVHTCTIFKHLPLSSAHITCEDRVLTAVDADICTAKQHATVKILPHSRRNLPWSRCQQHHRQKLRRM